MRLKNGYSLRLIAGSWIVVPVGSATVSFKGMITLNGCGAVLWKQLETERTEQELLQALQQEYAVDEQTAIQDIREYVGKLSAAGLLA